MNEDSSIDGKSEDGTRAGEEREERDEEEGRKDPGWTRVDSDSESDLGDTRYCNGGVS